MKATGRTCIVAAAMALVTLPAIGDTPKGDPARGKAAYMKNWCHTCHGTAGQGGDRGSGGRIAPNALPLEAFAQMVRRPRDLMPRYDAQFVSDQELADMHAYLSSIKPGPKSSEIPLLRE